MRASLYTAFSCSCYACLYAEYYIFERYAIQTLIRFPISIVNICINQFYAHSSTLQAMLRELHNYNNKSRMYPYQAKIAAEASNIYAIKECVAGPYRRLGNEPLLDTAHQGPARGRPSLCVKNDLMSAAIKARFSLANQAISK